MARIQCTHWHSWLQSLDAEPKSCFNLLQTEATWEFWCWNPGIQGKPQALPGCSLRSLTFSLALFLLLPALLSFQDPQGINSVHSLHYVHHGSTQIQGGSWYPQAVQIQIMLGWQLTLSFGTWWKCDFQPWRSPRVFYLLSPSFFALPKPQPSACPALKGCILINIVSNALGVVACCLLLPPTNCTLLHSTLYFLGVEKFHLLDPTVFQCLSPRVALRYTHHPTSVHNCPSLFSWDFLS